MSISKDVPHSMMSELFKRNGLARLSLNNKFQFWKENTIIVKIIAKKHPNLDMKHPIIAKNIEILPKNIQLLPNRTNSSPKKAVSRPQKHHF